MDRRTSSAALPRRNEVSAWFALLAPAGTPRDVIARLNGETRRALGEELAALIVADGARWARAIKQSCARLD